MYAPVVFDINNDGYQDLVYGGPKWKDIGFIDERAPINVFLNSTENTFIESGAQVFSGNVPTYTHVREMVLGDFYGDGSTSILVANNGYDWAPFPGQNNSILKNNGDGTLTEDVGSSATHNYMGFTHSADAADIDGDGDIDVIYTDITGNDVGSNMLVRVLKNDGSGNFSRAFLSIAGNTWTSTKLVDLDNDGYPEIVLGSIDSGSQSVVIKNNGTGEF